MQADLVKIMPSLVMAFTVMMVKDLMINSASSVQAEDTNSPKPIDTSSQTITPPKPDTSFDFEESDEDEDEYVAPKSVNSYSKQLMVKFLICTSWGYKNAFAQYQKLLAERYGENVQVSLETYPVDPMKQTIASAISLVKFFLLFLIISQTNPLTLIGQAGPEDAAPAWLEKLRESKVYACLMIFFVCNAIESTLTSTGAFEVYANDQLIASKLETGNVPQPNTIAQKLDEMLGKSPGSDHFSQGF